MKKLGTHFMINNGRKEMAANAVEPVVMKKQKKKKRPGLLTRRGHRAIIMMIKYFIISFEKEKQKC